MIDTLWSKKFLNIGFTVTLRKSLDGKLCTAV